MNNQNLLQLLIVQFSLHHWRYKASFSITLSSPHWKRKWGDFFYIRVKKVFSYLALSAVAWWFRYPVRIWSCYLFTYIFVEHRLLKLWWPFRILDLQAKFVSAHQPEIQFGKRLTMKILVSGTCGFIIYVTSVIFYSRSEGLKETWNDIRSLGWVNLVPSRCSQSQIKDHFWNSKHLILLYWYMNVFSHSL